MTEAASAVALGATGLPHRPPERPGLRNWQSSSTYPSPANSGAERHVAPDAPLPGTGTRGVTSSITHTGAVHRDSPLYSTIGSTGASRCRAPNLLPRQCSMWKFETFTVQFGRPDDGRPDLEHWLRQSNNAFGGRTPESFLTGNEAERQFMDRFIGALEHGVFS